VYLRMGIIIVCLAPIIQVTKFLTHNPKDIYFEGSWWWSRYLFLDG